MGPAEILGMRVIDDPKDGFTFRADHDWDLGTIDTSVFEVRGSDLGLAMGTFHVGTSNLASAVD